LAKNGQDTAARRRKRTPPAPREASPHKLEAMIETVAEAIVSCAPDGRVETWNAGAAHIFGRSAADMVGQQLSIIIPSGYAKEFSQRLADAARGTGSVLFRSMGEHVDGSLMSLSVSLAPLWLEGEIAGTCMIARDVTAVRKAEEEAERASRELAERESAMRAALTALRNSHEELKSTQLQLIQAAKLDSVGRLAAGVAHEVKNPLAMILAGTEYLLSLPNGAGGPAAEPVLRDIRAAVERANAVIGGLLNYSASTELTPAEASLHAVIEQSLLLVQHAITRGRVRVEKELAPGLPKLMLDVPKMEQVFINLFINAIDAMPEGGTLTIRTQRKQLSAADNSVGHRRTDALRVGESVILATVSDTGTGIPAEHLTRLFDPFFTTKPTGKGTGLGLAVSRTIVSLHGGTVWMSNRPEGGAMATVVLRSVTA